jgi:DNA primase catalytic core
MGRIAAGELERLKAEISLERLAEARGVALTRHGADLIGLCPFHDDKLPSLVISPQKNLWHCLGACQTGGSVIDWVMRAEGVSFRHAVELLREGFSPLAASQRRVKLATVPKLPTPVAFDADDQALLDQVIDYYHATLKQSPEALAYLEKRGIGSAEAIDTFKLGYANRTLGLRLPEKNRKAGAALRSQLQRIGILRESGHEHFNGSLVIPVLDGQGHVCEVYGRKILDNLRPGTAYHLYLPGPHRGVWNERALTASKEIILCEALIDALTFWVAGFRNVTASYGVGGFTADHLAAFQRHRIERVLIGYDRDEAGNQAAEKLAERLRSAGLACFRILFPKGMDANAYALKVTPAAKSLGVAIRSAQWLGTGRAPAIRTAAEPAPLGVAEVIDVADVVDVAGIAGAAVITATPNAIVEPRAAERADEETAAVVENGAPEGAGVCDVVPLAAEPALPASPLPALPESPADAIAADASEHEIVIALGDRRYRVRGLQRNLSYEQLKVNVLVSRVSSVRDAREAYHVDTLDLYSARHRAVYIKQAALELALEERVIKADLGAVLLKLEALQEQHIRATLEKEPAAVPLDEQERRAALELLNDRRLLERILEDLECCGVVGEETNKLVGYLACVSRKLERPLAVLIQSSSAAGKSALMEALLRLMPEEETVQYSAMTGQSLFYMGETDLKHKILGLAEQSGMQEASYALKLLQSQGELTIASTGKDPTSGRLVTHEYRVEGPVMLFLTTTAVEIDEELLNRCVVLSVNESREQTQAIHAAQRSQHTLAGLLAQRQAEERIAVHRNAQRLLRPLLVANPYAESLTFLSDRTRTRRDHLKYLTLIRAIALLHQHQRPLRTAEQEGKRVEYIEVTLEDIRLANRLAHEVLGRTLDELPPQTRTLLGKIHAMVSAAALRQGLAKSDVRFSRREVREHTGWGNTQLKVHLHRLEEMEYLLVHRGGRGQSFVYELLYDGEGEDGRAFLTGLLDPDTLASANALARDYDGDRSGPETEKSGSSRPQVGPWSPPGRGGENANRESDTTTCSDRDDDRENRSSRAHVAQSSYRPRNPPLAAAAAPRGGAPRG